MNLYQNSNSSSDILFLKYNQNNTSLEIGSKTGFKLVTFESPEKLRISYEDALPDVFLVERLFSTPMIAFVTLSSPRKLILYHFKTRQEIQSLSYTNTILAARMNRSRLVVCLEDCIYIHRMNDFMVEHVIRDAPLNKNGLIALSYNDVNYYLAYPGSQTSGEVVIFDVINYQTKTVINAHDNPLAAIAFNKKGSKISTASEKGTVIRVFSVTNSQLLFEFRRGYARCVSIFSLCFSEDSQFLAASSNTQTVHIFKLENPNEVHNKIQDESWMSYINNALISSADYLPGQISDLMKQWRSFAQAMIPFQSNNNIVALSKLQGEYRVLVASTDGYLYIYNLDVKNGGDCTLLKQHKLTELTMSSSAENTQTSADLNVFDKYDGDFPLMTS